MRTGKDLIHATRPYVGENVFRSWWEVLSTGLLLITSLAASALLTPLTLRLACCVLTGLLIVRFFVIYHDHQHGAILHESKIAGAIMTVFGCWVLSPSRIWKTSHNFHHAHNSKLHTAHVGSFPIMTKAEFHRSPWSTRVCYRWSRHPLTIAFGYLSVFMLGMCIVPFLSQPRRYYTCLIALILHAAIGVTVATQLGTASLLLTFFLPHVLSSAIGSYLFYAQHNFPEVTHTHADGWTYHGAALESSSFIQMPKILHWFTGNIGYHHVHHLNAKIPFYRLPKAMAEIPELRSPRLTSLAPAEIHRCLRLDVWDTKTKRMVSL